MGKLEPKPDAQFMAIQIIADALHEVMGKVAYVQKDATNDFHKYRYVSEMKLLDALRPAMVDVGLMLIPSFESGALDHATGNTDIIMSYTLMHKSGAVWPEKIRVPGCGNDKNSKGIGDKGVYKAMTGANKYLLFKLFQIATGDDPEVDAAPQQAATKQLHHDELVETYLQASQHMVNNFTTSEELKAWWNDAIEDRASLGLVKGNPAYDKLVETVSKRVNTLKGTKQ
jgi:hypothetical protein